MTGKPIWPINEKPVPASDVPGESASPTQPFPTRPAPFEEQGITLDGLADFTPEIRAAAEKAIAPYRIGPLFTPAVDTRDRRSAERRWRRQLGRRGRRSGDRHALCAFQKRLCGCSRGPAGSQIGRKSSLYEWRGESSPSIPGGVPLLKPPYSRMTAINMNTGDHAWMVPTGNGDRVRNLPALKPLNLPPVGGDANLTGPSAHQDAADLFA